MPDRIAEIKAEIKELRKRWPAHSTPPALLIMLDDLEDELVLEKAKSKVKKDQDAEKNRSN